MASRNTPGSLSKRNFAELLNLHSKLGSIISELGPKERATHSPKTAMPSAGRTSNRGTRVIAGKTFGLSL
jgi:hypothetical protein